MSENIYESPPILFGDKSSENEYQRKQREITKKLLEATESENTYEFLVKIIYGEDFSLPVRLLDTKAEAYGEHVPKLIEAVRLVDSYNEFVGEDVADALKYLHEKGCISTLKFGRENSPCAYISIPYFENQASNYVEREGYSPRKFTDYERQGMYKVIERTLQPTKPDEYDVDSSGYVRAWWD